MRLRGVSRKPACAQLDNMRVPMAFFVAVVIGRVTVAASVADANGLPIGASITASTEARSSGSRATAQSSASSGRPSGSCSHRSRKMRNTGTPGSIAYRFTRLLSVCLRAAAVRLPSTFSSTTTRA